MRRRLLLALALALPVQAAEVRVFAAASLTDALQEVARVHVSMTADKVLFNFGASSILARQIEAGAPADLFLSADEEKMDRLARRGRIDARTRVSVLSNALVVVVPARGGTNITDPRQLAQPMIRSVALAEPSSVPAGIYARQWLERLGLWNALAPKVVSTENVRGALAAVVAGNVDAAVVYRTDARISKHVRVAYAVPRDAAPRISYPFAVVADAENAQAARRFLAFLRSKPALDIFARHGFDVVR